MTAPVPQAGLCNLCRHQQVVRSGRGSLFSLCRRAKTDPAFPKYPRLPVVSCGGFAAREGESERQGESERGST